MQPSEFRLYSWLLAHTPKATCNLASSGLSEPDLPKMGIDTSYEHFAGAHVVDHELLLKEIIAELYQVDPENIVLTSGASEAIFLAFSVFGRNKTAVVPLPEYEPMFLVPKALGMRVSHSRTTPLGRNSMFALSDPNNPTGMHLDEDGQGMLIDAARDGVTVFVNETYKEFTFPDRPLSLFQRERELITCTSMTKFYGLGWLRVGWLIAERKKARKMTEARWLICGHNSEYSLWIAKQVLDRRKQFVKRAQRIYNDNLAIAGKLARSASGFDMNLPSAAPFCLAQYQGRSNSVSLALELLKKKGVLVSPGDYFGAPGAFRLAFKLEGQIFQRAVSEFSNFMSMRFRR